jgi:pentatricopeptide repeat protein
MKKLIDSKRYKDALDLFDRHSNVPTDLAFNLALKACTKLADRGRGIRIHQKLSPQSLQDPFIQTSLIHFYSKSRSPLTKCTSVAHNGIRMTLRVNYSLYRTIISIAINPLFSFLVQCRDVDEAQRIFSTVTKKSVFLYGALFKGRCSSVHEYLQQLLVIIGYVFNGMPEKVLQMVDRMSVQPDEVIATILFNACAKVNNSHAVKLGKTVLSQLPAVFFEDQILVTAGIDMLMRFGHVEDAEHLFLQTKRQNVFSYGVMMNGYNINDLPTRALDLFLEFSDIPNANMYTTIYTTYAALSDERAITSGKRLLEKMPKIFKDDLIVMGSAIHMLMKFGDVKQAELLFSQMKERDASSYGVMMNGYNLNGLPEKALNLFDQASSMLNPNLYTIIYTTCATLCSEIAITLGKQILDKMPTMFNDNLIVMGSAIHMLMKFGDVKQAELLFSQMEKRGPSSYGVMMNGYNINNEPLKCLKLFEDVKRQKIKLDERVYISLVGAYSRMGMISMCREAVKQISTEAMNSSTVQHSLIDMWVSS